MSDLPPPQAPLYNHPLPALERWLVELGARQAAPHSCLWQLQRSGWTATLDEQPVEIHRADDAFKAVFVPAGTHRVRFEYHSARTRAGLAISLASGLFLLAVSLACGWRAWQTRPKTPETPALAENSGESPAPETPVADDATELKTPVLEEDNEGKE